MSRIESHRELLVWQKAMDLAVAVYQLSANFPSKESYRLVAQITRSAVSVPANIAEGKARATQRDYSHFSGGRKGFSNGNRDLCDAVHTARIHKSGGCKTDSGTDNRDQQDANRASIQAGAERPLGYRLWPMACSLWPVMAFKRLSWGRGRGS